MAGFGFKGTAVMLSELLSGKEKIFTVGEVQVLIQ